MDTPASIVPHQPDYNQDAWKEWNPYELGNAIAFFIKRSGHRASPVKKTKDLTDAQNYLNMLQAHLDEAKKDKGPTPI
jgi:hypothetical protein